MGSEQDMQGQYLVEVQETFVLHAPHTWFGRLGVTNKDKPKTKRHENHRSHQRMKTM